MILERRYLPFKEIGNIFKIVAEELDLNINTQILIQEDILNELFINNCNYNVYFHNYPDNSFVSQWYTLHESNAFSPVLSNLGVRSFCHNYSQVTRFYFRDYYFLGKAGPKEFISYKNELHRILVIEVS